MEQATAAVVAISIPQREKEKEKPRKKISQNWELEQKITQAAKKSGVTIVNKSHASLQEIKRLPRFVSDYVLTKFTDNGKTVEDAVEFVALRYPEARDKHKILSDLMRAGEYVLLDEFKVETDIKAGKHRLSIPCLDVKDGSIDQKLISQYEDLLRWGLWGMAKLKYDVSTAEFKDSGAPIRAVEFEPFSASLNYKAFLKMRNEFSSNEWVDVVINTLGLNAEQYEPRQKVLLLMRLVPLVEANVNLVELGPKATGKTFFYRNASFHARIISGGVVSPANLFFNLNSKALGILAVKDTIVFDEVSRVKFQNPDEMVGKLKDYMASGQFERGVKQSSSTCSLVFIGNYTDEGAPGSPAHFFSALPEPMRDTAFVDRIHAFLPGWEMPKITRAEESLSNGYGIAGDVFSEAMHELRKHDYRMLVRKAWKSDCATIRDEQAVERVASGLLKVLAPHGTPSQDEVKLAIQTAVEQRQRVCDWLHAQAPNEFPKKKL